MPENVLESSFLKALFQVLCPGQEHFALTPGSAPGVRTVWGASSSRHRAGLGGRSEKSLLFQKSQREWTQAKSNQSWRLARAQGDYF